MNFNNFTIKAQEAVQKAQEIATAFQSPAIEPDHLLKAMLSVDENVLPWLFKKLNVNLGILTKALDKMVASHPKVTGGEIYLSNDSNKALQKATAITHDMKDEFVSIEHMLLGLLAAGDTTSRLLKDSGVT